MSRVVLTITVATFICGFVPHARAELIAGLDIIPPPRSVESEPAGHTNDHQQAFDERQGVVLPENISIDGGNLTAGTLVDSHMIFLNPDGAMNAEDLEQTWVFDGPIIGVLSDQDGNFEADTSPFLGAEVTVYPAAFPFRGLEPIDSYVVDGNSITVSMTVNSDGDWMRVLTAPPKVLYVDNRVPAMPPPDGNSWNTAFPFLRDALQVASIDPLVGVIRVGRGADLPKPGPERRPYRPDESLANPMGDNDRSKTFEMVAGVTVQGGYAGFGEADPDALDPDVFITTLSGDLMNNDDTSIADNSYNIVTFDIAGSAELDGFRITGGNADGAGFDSAGAAVQVLSGGVTIRNCTLFVNTASSCGAGLYTISTDVVQIDNCAFIDNSALLGGGICIAPVASVSIFNSVLAANAATDAGAILNTGVLIVDGIVMNDNTAAVADGILNKGTLRALAGGIAGSSEVINVGELSPGQDPMDGSAGSSVINNPFAQVSSADPSLPAGVLDMHIAETMNDSLTINSPSSLGGGIQLDLDGAFVPMTGDCIEVISGASLSGTFGVAYVPDYLPTQAPTITYGPCALNPFGTGAVTVGFTDLITVLSLSPEPPFAIKDAELPVAVVVGSFNPSIDPFLDIAILFEGNQGVLANSSVGIYLGDGAGGFMAGTTVKVGPDPSAIATADLNNDTFLDLAVTNKAIGGEGSVHVLLNDPGGLGNFVNGAGSPFMLGFDSQPSDLALANLDALVPDTDIDIAVSLEGFNQAVVLTNDGAGVFVASPGIDVGDPATSIAVAEYSGDTEVDLAVTVDSSIVDENGLVIVLAGDGLGGFGIGAGETEESQEIGLKPKDIMPEKVDNNKDVDGVVINGESNDISILINGGDGLDPSISLELDGEPKSFTTLDIDSDDDEDIAVVIGDDLSGYVSILRNDLDANGQVIYTLDQDIILPNDENPLLVASGDFDGDGDDDLIIVSSLPVPEGVAPTARFGLVRNNTAPPPPSVPGDIDEDGDVDTADLLALLAAWGPCPGCPEDINDDGEVSTADLLILLANWGE